MARIIKKNFFICCPVQASGRADDVHFQAGRFVKETLWLITLRESKQASCRQEIILRRNISKWKVDYREYFHAASKANCANLPLISSKRADR